MSINHLKRGRRTIVPINFPIPWFSHSVPSPVKWHFRRQKFDIMDTPGNLDFMSEALAALHVADFAEAVYLTSCTVKRREVRGEHVFVVIGSEQ